MRPAEGAASAGSADADGQLAELGSGVHAPEGIRRLFQRDHRVHDGAEAAPGEEGQHLAEFLLGPNGAPP